jgi:hypothetical protein
MLAASVLLGLIVCASSGCKAWGHKSWGHWGKWDDDGFPEDEQKLTENVRPREPNSSIWSTSAKGRQVERNLGIGRD